MKRQCITFVFGVLCLSGCGEEPPAIPATPVAAPATAEAVKPAEPMLQPPVDLSARAEKLGAVPYSQLSQMKVGEEAIFLLQGQAMGAAVYGSGPYTIDSSPPVAAVHAGLVKDGHWALVRVKVVAHSGDHPGTEANGVRSRNWGKLDRSYTIELVQ